MIQAALAAFSVLLVLSIAYLLFEIGRAEPDPYDFDKDEQP